MFLSDDNELTPKCIKRFRKVAKRDHNKNVYHYNINVIDMANKLISKGKRFPRVIKVDKLFKKVFYKDYPAPLSSFYSEEVSFKRDLSPWRRLTEAILQLYSPAQKRRGSGRFHFHASYGEGTLPPLLPILPLPRAWLWTGWSFFAGAKISSKMMMSIRSLLPTGYGCMPGAARLFIPTIRRRR